MAKCPHQKGTIFQNSALRAPFSQKRLKMVPSRKKGTVFAAKKGKKWCPSFQRGTATKIGKKWCRLAKGYYISALGALFLYGKDAPKGHQNSAPKGTVLRTVKRFQYRLFFSVLYSGVK